MRDDRFAKERRCEGERLEIEVTLYRESSIDGEEINDFLKITKFFIFVILTRFLVFALTFHFGNLINNF